MDDQAADLKNTTSDTQKPSDADSVSSVALKGVRRPGNVLLRNGLETKTASTVLSFEGEKVCCGELLSFRQSLGCNESAPKIKGKLPSLSNLVFGFTSHSHP